MGRSAPWALAGEPADHLVGDAVALQDPHDPREGFPYLLRLVARVVHDVRAAV